MTIKELKKKLENLPEEAEVRLMTDSENNPLQNYYDAEFVYYLELIRESGARAVYIAP